MAVSLTGQGQKNEVYYQDVMREAFGRTFELAPPGLEGGGIRSVGFVCLCLTA